MGLRQVSVSLQRRYRTEFTRGHSVLLFLDTEFATPQAPEIVSLALISEDGRFEFYAERDPLPEEPSDFVREHVYPLLERGAHALPDHDFCKALRSFIAQVGAASDDGKVTIAYDYHCDISLLDFALSGFGEHVNEPALPSLTTLDLESLGEAFSATVKARFESSPSVLKRRHHALGDAQVNRDAYAALRNTRHA